MRGKSLSEHLPYPLILTTTTATSPPWLALCLYLYWAPTLIPYTDHCWYHIACYMTGSVDPCPVFAISFTIFTPTHFVFCPSDKYEQWCIHPALPLALCGLIPRAGLTEAFLRGSPAVLNKVAPWEMGLWREVMLVMSDRIHPHISPQPQPLLLPHSQWAPFAPFAVALLNRVAKCHG